MLLPGSVPVRAGGIAMTIPHMNGGATKHIPLVVVPDAAAMRVLKHDIQDEPDGVDTTFQLEADLLSAARWRETKGKDSSWAYLHIVQTGHPEVILAFELPRQLPLLDQIAAAGMFTAEQSLTLEPSSPFFELPREVTGGFRTLANAMRQIQRQQEARKN